MSNPSIKNFSSQLHAFIFLTIILLATACNGPDKKVHPKLIKTIGDPNYGNVQCILQDKKGNLWFGTTENGLYKYDGKSFQQFFIADGEVSNSINDMLEDKDGNIWLGTKKGIWMYDGVGYIEVKINYPKDLPPNKNKFYQTHLVSDIMEDHTGKLWFVTIDGLYTYDGKSFTLFKIDEAKNGQMSDNDKVERIMEDRDGNIWFGGRTNSGVFRYDGKTIINFKLDTLFQNGPKPKPHDWAWPQVQDKNGNIWFSNWGGAYRYDGKEFTTFSKQEGIPGIVTKIIEDKNGNIWFGGDGISIYNSTAPLNSGKGSFVSYGVKDGFENPGVWSTLEDKDGNIWVGTRATGLYLYDSTASIQKDGKTFISYSEYKK